MFFVIIYRLLDDKCNSLTIPVPFILKFVMYNGSGALPERPLQYNFVMVESLTLDQGAVSPSLTSVTVLCP